MNKPMTQTELQHIEHCNKVLQEHFDLVATIVSETDAAIGRYIPSLEDYVNAINGIQSKFGKTVIEIGQNVQSLKHITSKTQQVIDFCQAVERLDKTLTPELVEKLQKVMK